MTVRWNKCIFQTLLCAGIALGTLPVFTLADEPVKEPAPATEQAEQKPVEVQQAEPKEESKPAQLEKVTIVIEGDALQQKGIHEWAGKAGQLVVDWYPKMDVLLKSDGYVPPKELKIVFRKMDGVAYTAGGEIHISADWIRRQPGDFGMVAHELVHVIQSYPPQPRRSNNGWVTEGIADYIRHAHFEPDVKLPRINPDTASYRDAYKTTAGFFIWIEKNYDKEFVKKLNVAMRERTYNDSIFETLTGKKLDDLWKEYADTFR